MKNPIGKTLIIIFLLLAFGAGIGLYSSSYYQQQMVQKPGIPGLLWPEPKQLRPFAGIDQNGEVFGLNNLQGMWSFVFFGFTNCPDICPLSLTVLDNVYRSLESRQQATDVQVIFATVDPERDSTEQLQQYLEYYNQKFIGIGGTEQQVASLARQIGVAYGKSNQQSTDEYQVDHTASIFLIDPQGRFVAVLSTPHESDEILQRFAEIRQFIEQQS